MALEHILGAIATGVTLVLDSCNFTSNQAIYGNTGSASSIFVFSGTPSLMISNILVQDVGGYALSALGASNITVSSSSFQGPTLTNTMGGIQISSTSNINLTNVSISGMNASQGSGILVLCDDSDNTQFYMNSLLISNCTAENGGAMFIQGVANVTLENSSFHSNQANSTNSGQGFGGAIYYNSDSPGQLFMIGSDVTFSNNFASKAGGALYYNAYKFSSLENPTFHNNSAAYGNDLGSYAISLGLITTPYPQLIDEYVRFIDPFFSFISENTLINYTNTSNRRILDMNQPYSITSGEVIFPPLVFCLLR